MADSHTRNGTGSVTIGIDAPGMTPYHRVGLAGLWMTLEAVERDSLLSERLLSTGGRWELSDRQITLKWGGDAVSFVRELLEVSFQIDKHGLIHFPGIGAPADNLEHATILQGALLGTFLQHGKNRKADPSRKPGGFLTAGDDGELKLQYRRVEWYAQQRAAGTGAKKPPRWCADLAARQTIAGWVWPGAVDRHMGLGNTTKISEPGWRYLVLLYAPVGAFYFRLRARTSGRRPTYCIVLPEITDLRQYAAARRTFARLPARDVVAAGGAQAALRVLALERSLGILDDLGAGRCSVVEFGTSAWSLQQKTRLAQYEAAPGVAGGFEAFEIADRVMPVRRVHLESGEWFWSAPQTPELVARNVLAGKPWWDGFAEFIRDIDRRDAVMGRRGSPGERKGLATMVQESGELLERDEHALVRACHEAWRSRLGQLGDRSRREGISFSRLVQKEFEQQRLRLTHCKDAATFRAAITEYWARAGRSLPALQESWSDLLPYLDERKWRAGRDLALLALASYSSPDADSDEELAAAVSDDVQGEMT